MPDSSSRGLQRGAHLDFRGKAPLSVRRSNTAASEVPLLDFSASTRRVRVPAPSRRRAGVRSFLAPLAGCPSSVPGVPPRRACPRLVPGPCSSLPPGTGGRMGTRTSDHQEQAAPG